MGAVFGYTRLAMGAHFLSDVIFAMLAMLAVMAVLQTAFFGKRATLQYWRCWLGGMVQQEGGMRPGSLPPASAGGSP